MPFVTPEPAIKPQKPRWTIVLAGNKYSSLGPLYMEVGPEQKVPADLHFSTGAQSWTMWLQGVPENHYLIRGDHKTVEDFMSAVALGRAYLIKQHVRKILYDAHSAVCKVSEALSSAYPSVRPLVKAQSAVKEAAGTLRAILVSLPE